MYSPCDVRNAYHSFPTQGIQKQICRSRIFVPANECTHVVPMYPSQSAMSHLHSLAQSMCVATFLPTHVITTCFADYVTSTSGAIRLAFDLVTLQLDIEAATQEYRQIKHYPALPPTPDIDFRPWTTYQSQAFELELYGNPPNATAKGWADWISCTEQYLLQEHPWAPQGRGANLQAVIKPLVSSQPTTTWKKEASVLGAASSQIPVRPTTTTAA